MRKNCVKKLVALCLVIIATLTIIEALAVNNTNVNMTDSGHTHRMEFWYGYDTPSRNLHTDVYRCTKPGCNYTERLYCNIIPGKPAV